MCSVLSGNRNFEARIHPEVKANYLASPPLVVAYALAGRMDIDFETEPTRRDDVYLRDIWPSAQEVERHDRRLRARRAVRRDVRRRLHRRRRRGARLPVPEGELFAWQPDSTYVRHPPYFEGMAREPGTVGDIEGARCLVWLGDSVTTDHISPAGSIRPDSPAGDYLVEHGVERKDFNSYGARRGNHEVMVRGTFANVRLRNKLVAGLGGNVDGARAVGRGDDDLRRVAALPRRGHAAGRARRQGVRLGLVARLGGEGAEPARRARR